MAKYGKSRWLGSALGAGLGTAATASGMGYAAPAAIKFGQWAGQGIKNVTGFGEYNVRSNALYEGAQVPFVRNEPTVAGTTVSHREYIMDVITGPSANTWNSQTFAINPALGSTFEWLAQIAANYEEYVMEGMLFCFRSMSADSLNSTNTALGTVIMATQYNTYQPPFVNKAEMESHNYSMSGRPSADMIHPIECDPHQSSITTFFTRNGKVPTGADQRLYDIGRFEIATTGFQAADVNIGELHVTYQVTLMKPRLWAALGRAAPYYHGTSPSGWGSTEPLGALPLIESASSTMTPAISYSLAAPATRVTIALPPASSPLVFRICIYQEMALNAAILWQFHAIANGTNETATYLTNPDQQPEAAVVAATSHHVSYIIKTRGDYFQTTIDLDQTYVGANATDANIFIVQLPNK